jgi:hypothetical protein
MWFYFFVFSIPIIWCCLFFKKGKLIWIPSIIYFSIELIVTIFFISQYEDISYAFVGTEGMFTACFLPLVSAWSMLCTLVTLLIQLLLKQNKKTNGISIEISAAPFKILIVSLLIISAITIIGMILPNFIHFT